MSELGQFIQSIPPITRTITLTSLVMAGFNSLGVVSYSAFVCYWPAVIEHFEIWRLFTAFLVAHPQPMQGLTEIYMLYRFSKGLEEGKFRNNLPDYIYYFMYVVPLILFFAFFLPASYSLSAPLLSATTFTWSVANYTSQVSFYFLPIKASLLPAVSLGFRLLIDGKDNFFLALAGMAAAYFYNCLETQTFGPLVGLLNGDNGGATMNSNRVGTLSSTNSVTWIYSVGYLPAPSWLKSAVSRLTGINYNSSAFHRSVSTFGSTAPRRGSSSSNSTAAASGSSFLKNPFERTAFKGKGRRLGSTEE